MSGRITYKNAKNGDVRDVLWPTADGQVFNWHSQGVSDHDLKNETPYWLALYWEPNAEGQPHQGIEPWGLDYSHGGGYGSVKIHVENPGIPMSESSSPDNAEG